MKKSATTGPSQPTGPDSRQGVAAVTSETDAAGPPTQCVRTDKQRRVSRHNWAEYALVLAGSAAAAFGGLVAEDMFPGRDAWLTTDWKLVRVGLLAAAVAVAWAAVRSLIRRRQLRGTLYYLRMQSDTNEDYHAKAIEEAAKDYLGFRAMAAWCDPGTGTVDVRRRVDQLSHELQRSTNDDSNDSGFDIAPNLIFPVALAVGYDWIPPGPGGPGPGGLRLREFSFRPGKEELQDFEWKLGCLSAAGVVPEKQSTVCGDPKCKVSHYQPSASGHLRAVTSGTALPGASVQTVWLEYRLTDTEYVDEFLPRHDHSVRVMNSPLKAAAEVRRVIHVEAGRAPNDAATTYALLQYTPGAPGKRADRPDVQCKCADVPEVPHVQEIAEGVAYWLGQTLRDYPKATVYVAAAMPKTVAFAMGYLMTRPPLRTPAAHPWRRIVPMGFFEREPNDLRPMWVRFDQRDPDELIAISGRP